MNPEPETTAPDDAEEWTFTDEECPLCGEAGTIRGRTHRRLFLRCPNCGHEYSREV